MPYPPGYEIAAYVATGLFTALAVMLKLASARVSKHTHALIGLMLDTVFAFSLVAIFTFDVNTSIFIVLYLLPLEAAMLYSPRAVLTIALVTTLAYTLREIWGSTQWHGYRGQEYPFLIVSITFRMGIDIMIALVASALARSWQHEHEAVNESQIQQVETMQRLAEVRENFATAVSHELRTPLTSVIGFADTLRRQLTDLGSQQQEMLDHLHSQAIELGDLIEQLTAMAGVDPNELSMGEHDLVQMLSDLVSKHDRRVHMEYAPDQAPVLVDGPRVCQAIGYLIDNALRYSSQPVHVSITEREYEERQGVVVRITDHGPGIPDQLKERIFLAFERVHRPSGPSPGTGAGLTAANNIILSNGGAIWVEDAPSGQGAQFCVWLPAWSPNRKVRGTGAARREP